MPSQIIAIISLVVALSVAIWQVRVNIRRAKKANVLPVTSAAIEEFRSESFRESLQELIISAQRNPPPVVGFEQVADDWRKHAYKICYFFEYLGALILFDIVEEDLIISLMSTQALQVWEIIEPYRSAELAYRRNTLPPNVPNAFLPHYEWLVRRIGDMGGPEAPSMIREHISTNQIRRFDLRAATLLARAHLRKSQGYGAFASPKSR